MLRYTTVWQKKKNVTELKGVIDYNTVLTRIAICVLVLTTWE